MSARLWCHRQQSPAINAWELCISWEHCRVSVRVPVQHIRGLSRCLRREQSRGPSVARYRSCIRQFYPIRMAFATSQSEHCSKLLLLFHPRSAVCRLPVRTKSPADLSDLWLHLEGVAVPAPELLPYGVGYIRWQNDQIPAFYSMLLNLMVASVFGSFCS